MRSVIRTITSSVFAIVYPDGVLTSIISDPMSSSGTKPVGTVLSSTAVITIPATTTAGASHLRRMGSMATLV